MKLKFRIVRDTYLGFEAQFRPLWFPFWITCGINTFASVEEARKYIDLFSRDTVVEHYEPKTKKEVSQP